jgi:hypothetical protein
MICQATGNKSDKKTTWHFKDLAVKAHHYIEHGQNDTMTLGMT